MRRTAAVPAAPPPEGPLDLPFAARAQQEPSSAAPTAAAPTAATPPVAQRAPGASPTIPSVIQAAGEPSTGIAPSAPTAPTPPGAAASSRSVESDAPRAGNQEAHASQLSDTAINRTPSVDSPASDPGDDSRTPSASVESHPAGAESAALRIPNEGADTDVPSSSAAVERTSERGAVARQVEASSGVAADSSTYSPIALELRQAPPSSAKYGAPSAISPPPRPSVMASSPSASAAPAPSAPSASPMAQTPSASSCPAIASSAPTAHSPATAAVSIARNGY